MDLKTSSPLNSDFIKKEMGDSRIIFPTSDEHRSLQASALAKATQFPRSKSAVHMARNNAFTPPVLKLLSQRRQHCQVTQVPISTATPLFDYPMTASKLSRHQNMSAIREELNCSTVTIICKLNVPTKRSPHSSTREPKIETEALQERYKPRSTLMRGQVANQWMTPVALNNGLSRSNKQTFSTLCHTHRGHTIMPYFWKDIHALLNRTNDGQDIDLANEVTQTNNCNTQYAPQKDSTIIKDAMLTVFTEHSTKGLARAEQLCNMSPWTDTVAILRHDVPKPNRLETWQMRIKHEWLTTPRHHDPVVLLGISSSHRYLRQLNGTLQVLHEKGMGALLCPYKVGKLSTICIDGIQKGDRFQSQEDCAKFVEGVAISKFPDLPITVSALNDKKGYRLRLKLETNEPEDYRTHIQVKTSTCPAAPRAARQLHTPHNQNTILNQYGAPATTADLSLLNILKTKKSFTPLKLTVHLYMSHVVQCEILGKSNATIRLEFYQRNIIAALSCIIDMSCAHPQWSHRAWRRSVLASIDEVYNINSHHIQTRIPDLISPCMPRTLKVSQHLTLDTSADCNRSTVFHNEWCSKFLCLPKIQVLNQKQLPILLVDTDMTHIPSPNQLRNTDSEWKLWHLESENVCLMQTLPLLAMAQSTLFDSLPVLDKDGSTPINGTPYVHLPGEAFNKNFEADHQIKAEAAIKWHTQNGEAPVKYYGLPHERQVELFLQEHATEAFLACNTEEDQCKVLPALLRIFEVLPGSVSYDRRSNRTSLDPGR